jgi:hypothetical protein
MAVIYILDLQQPHFLVRSRIDIFGATEKDELLPSMATTRIQRKHQASSKAHVKMLSREKQAKVIS